MTATIATERLLHDAYRWGPEVVAFVGTARSTIALLLAGAAVLAALSIVRAPTAWRVPVLTLSMCAFSAAVLLLLHYGERHWPWV